jgi:hypothetical protein
VEFIERYLSVHPEIEALLLVAAITIISLVALRWPLHGKSSGDARRP